MSIEVKGVSKFYGSQAALNDVSFSVKRGEIVGFLGPNGAGKSTMMKIITCYLPPSKGEVKVAGHDIIESSLTVRRKVGDRKSVVEGQCVDQRGARSKKKRVA